MIKMLKEIFDLTFSHKVQIKSIRTLGLAAVMVTVDPDSPVMLSMHNPPPVSS